jgi:hypothetical protein
MAFEDEARIGNGYPLHKWLAVGELRAAAKEVVKEYPILAAITRDHYLAYKHDDVPVPTCDLILLANELEKDAENALNKNTDTLNNSEDGE